MYAVLTTLCISPLIGAFFFRLKTNHMILSSTPVTSENDSSVCF